MENIFIKDGPVKFDLQSLENRKHEKCGALLAIQI